MKCTRCGENRVLLLNSWAECDCVAYWDEPLPCDKWPPGAVDAVVRRALYGQAVPGEVLQAERPAGLNPANTHPLAPMFGNPEHTHRCPLCNDQSPACTLPCDQPYMLCDKCQAERDAFEAGAARVRWLMAREPELEQRMGHRAHVLALLTQWDLAALRRWSYREMVGVSGETIERGTLERAEAAKLAESRTIGAVTVCALTADGRAFCAALRKHGLPAFAVEP